MARLPSGPREIPGLGTELFGLLFKETTSWMLQSAVTFSFLAENHEALLQFYMEPNKTPIRFDRNPHFSGGDPGSNLFGFYVNLHGSKLASLFSLFGYLWGST